jgi:hypothetical protein
MGTHVHGTSRHSVFIQEETKAKWHTSQSSQKPFCNNNPVTAKEAEMMGSLAGFLSKQQNKVHTQAIFFPISSFGGLCHSPVTT